MKHTKGKWKTEGANVLTENRLIANCTGNGVSVTEEDKANAKLISQAPELLIAAQMLLIAIKHGDIILFPNSDETPDYIQILENVVNKAI